jgi:hypothetical protein
MERVSRSLLLFHHRKISFVLKWMSYFLQNLQVRMQVGRNRVNQWLTQATHQDYFWVLV